MDIGKLFFIYESIMKCEQRMGKFVPQKELENAILHDKSIRNKLSKKMKISKGELDHYIQLLIAYGIIFIPRKGFIERLYNFDWKDVKWAKKCGLIK